MRTCQFWPKVLSVASSAARISPATEQTLKPVRWVADSRRVLQGFPEEVKDEIGTAILWAQMGGIHPSAKPLRGFGNAQVVEIVDNYDGDTYRAVYTVRFENLVYVLHVFQKKSKKGNKTPKHDIDLIKGRLNQLTIRLNSR